VGAGGGGGEAAHGASQASGPAAETSSGPGSTTNAVQSSGIGTSSVGSGGQGGGGAGGGPSAGLAELGTLVVLGDSIGDGGGQGPFYYARLRDMLEAKYGAIAYHREADSGSKTGALLGQIDGLPGQLPGPVAVAITSGGNDMKDSLPLILAGADQAARTTMGGNIDAALSALLEFDRFGAGVIVHVFEANIYDASAGVGDFGQHDCAFGQGLPAIPTDTFFANWNGEIAARVQSHGQILMDMHGHFYDHGYAGSPSWFASDCTHPNTLGHAALADYFYTAITGETPP
jgi:lysophospholipase L1-like esterase